MTDQSRSSELYGFDIVFAVVGIVILLLTLLDHLQDGKAESGLVAFGILLIVGGALLYSARRKPGAKDS